MGVEGDERTGQRSKFYESLIHQLVEFAKCKFFWSGKAADGGSQQTHVDIAKKSPFAASVITDQTFEDVPEEVDCPFELKHIWEWFFELDATRQNGMGLGPLTNQEIYFWAHLQKKHILSLEVTALLAVDRAYIIHHNSKKE